jgi:hypothetical protein
MNLQIFIDVLGILRLKMMLLRLAKHIIRKWNTISYRKLLMSLNYNHPLWDINISNMKKIILAALVVASLFASCSSEKTFKKKDGSTITAKPYGWASKENKVEGVNYELNAPDVVASIIFAPSVIAPVLLTAYDVWEPVSYTEPSK